MKRAVTQLHWSGYTHRGKVRTENEDSFLCLEFDSMEMRYLGRIGEVGTREADHVFAVSDGMGGAMAGEFASKIVVDMLADLFPRTFRQGASGFNRGIKDLLAELYSRIHETLEQMGQFYEECRGMGATLSLCWFTPHRVYFAHVGDSRVYYVPAGQQKIQRVTHDDSHVGWLYRSGKISEREARTHPRRSALSKSLGAGNMNVEPQVGVVEYEAGDAFFLCSDGVVESLSDAQIQRLLFKPEPNEAKQLPADRVVNYAVHLSGKDNTTAIFVETS
jgi:serine/threonine protein phosphatase PrpC